MKKIIAITAFLLANLVWAEWPHSNISQAVFARSVADRAPLGIISEAENSLKKVYFFTNIRHLSGEKITHRWSYKGKVKAEISFEIGSKRWRVWSSKNLWHNWTGDWKVEVLNRAGDILLSKKFSYKKAGENE
ncbi:MAG: DUF2914 domain-containing protein [Candidatus Thioglobus sp.]|nr:DUF2914 domain-containing protein [Candidatus Thioglobus sp.]